MTALRRTWLALPAAMSIACGAQAGSFAPLSATASLPMPEEQLVGAIELARGGRVGESIRALEALLKRQPNFRLAQLIYADLLAAYDLDAFVLTDTHHGDVRTSWLAERGVRHGFTATQLRGDEQCHVSGKLHRFREGDVVLLNSVNGNSGTGIYVGDSTDAANGNLISRNIVNSNSGDGIAVNGIIRVEILGFAPNEIERRRHVAGGQGLVAGVHPGVGAGQRHHHPTPPGTGRCAAGRLGERAGRVARTADGLLGEPLGLERSGPCRARQSRKRRCSVRACPA